MSFFTRFFQMLNSQLGDWAKHGFGSMVMTLLLAMFWRIFMHWTLAVYVAAVNTMFFGLGIELGGNRSIRDLILDLTGIIIMIFMCGGFGSKTFIPVIF